MLKSLLFRSRAYYLIDPTFSNCPSCKSISSIKRSHSRNYKEKFITKISFSKYYRCKKCGWRGRLRTVAFTSSSYLVMLSYLILLIVAGLVTYIVLKRLL